MMEIDIVMAADLRKRKVLYRSGSGIPFISNIF